MAKKGDTLESRLGSIEAELRSIRALYERTLSYKTNDPVTSMMHARKAAEAICRQIFLREYGASPGNLMLDGLIEKLNARGALPRTIALPMRTIQGYGNFAAHAQDGSGPEEITPEYIQPCLQALATVVEWYFAEQHRQAPEGSDAVQATARASPAGREDPAGAAGGGDAAPPRGVRLGELARRLGISDAAAIRLARERLRLELRTPSALLTAAQAEALEGGAAEGGGSAPAAPATRAIVLAPGVELELVLVPAGTYLMGSPQEEEGHNDDEVVHEVTISRAFYLGRQLVTQLQYEAVVGSNPSYFRGPALPVEMVSWFDACAFCELLAERHGRQFRLPTEAEWEYACRAGTVTPFSCGPTLTTALANFDGKFTYGPTPAGETRWRTTPAGAFPPNPWGLHDLHGNVWEWCSDWYGEYGDRPVTDPGGPGEGDIRILRGGSWFNGPADARSAQRDALDPGRRHSIYGFRVAMQVG